MTADEGWSRPIEAATRAGGNVGVRPSPLEVTKMFMSPSRCSRAAAGALACLLVASLAAAVTGAGEVEDVGSFGPAGVFPEERRGVAATILMDGRVLFVGGDVEATVSSAFLWDPVDQAFGPAGPLEAPRVIPTATLLVDGRVLVVGGLGGSTTDLVSLASAEMWDPATASFGRTGSVGEARAVHTATRLVDGRVLVVGGVLLHDGTPRTLASAEVWDPTSETFSPTGSLAEARYGHTASLLPDGRVLVVGGVVAGGPGFEIRASAEAWDPTSGAFSAAGSLPDGRINHTATLLPDGRVLVVGGVGNGGASLLASAVLWDPKTESFSQTGALQSGRAHHTATSLPDGAVLIVGGGGDAGVLQSAEMWDPTTGVFHPAGSLAKGRSDHTAALLADGRVVIAGGDDDDVMFTASAEVWSPTSSDASGESP